MGLSPSPTRFSDRLLACCLSLLTAWAILSIQPAAAAVVGDCRLVMDGSSDPPGDRIACSVGLLPDDHPARLELRAFVLPTATGERPAAVKASSEHNRGTGGELLVVADVSDKPESETSLVVPYADLSLPIGQYRIGYVVSLRVKQRVVWTQALPATLLRVTAAARDHVRPQLVGPEASMAPRTSKAYVAGRSLDKAPQLQLNQQPTGPPAVETKPAVVPGGFERATVENPAAKTPIAVTARQSELTGLAGQPWQPLSKVAAGHEREVYFATNRKPIAPAAAGEKLKFGSELADGVVYGKCTVNFPVRHAPGELPTPSWWNSADPEQYFLVEAVDRLTADQLGHELSEHDILLFVHGYSNTFEDAVLRAGQLQYDTEFPGNAVAFSWPADGSLSPDAYKADALNAEKSARPLADFLEMLTKSADASSPPAKVHVIAHSMGNRVFLAALHDLVQRGVWKEGEKHLGQVVLAAPDVGAARFNNVVGYAIGAAQRLTYYYCRTDRALTVSQSINYWEPVGLYPYFEIGLDTINADGVGTDFISHSYYGSSPRVLADLHLVFCSSYAPSKRMPPLSSHSTVYGHDHWSFLPVVIQEE